MQKDLSQGLSGYVTCATGLTINHLCILDAAREHAWLAGGTVTHLLLAPYCDYGGCFTYVIPVCSDGASTNGSLYQYNFATGHIGTHFYCSQAV